jgi:hypothetical protein
MVVAMPVSGASRKASLNHNLTGCDHGGASCCDSVIDDLHWYLQPAIGKKPRKAAAGQKEMLLPISGKRAAKEDGKKADKRGTSRARKSARAGGL